MRSIDRSDQKYQNSRATLSLSGVRFKQAVVHLFTMSKDPAEAHPSGWLPPNLLSLLRRFGSAFAVVSPEVGGARRDRTDDILLAKQALSQLSYGPITETCQQKLVGPGRLELPTSRLSGVRSNHLSYGPHWHTPVDPSARSGERTLTRDNVACEERETKAASVPQ